MPSGSCLCGQLKYTYSGEPAMKCICHCLTCRKISGSAFSTALLVPQPSFNFEKGVQPKITDIKHETGMDLHVNACPECGHSVGKTADGFPGMFIVWAGSLDGDEKEWAQTTAPQAELYIKYRAEWVGEVKGAKQCQEFE